MSETIDPGRIVVAADGSDHAERAVLWAAEQASLEHRPFVVVAVGEDAPSISERAIALIRRIRPGLSVQALCRRGDPRRVLLDLSSDAHLIVVGSRGRGTLKSMLLGSVSAAVSAHAACPVVVCRPTPNHHPRQGIILGVDGTHESLPVIEFAYRQASLRGLPLTALHCFWDAAAAFAEYRNISGAAVDAPDLEDLRAALATAVAGFGEKYPDVPVTLELKHGFVDEALTPRGNGWDLIVVGRHPVTSVTRLVTGSIATAVLERARATVAVIPEAPPSS